MVQGVQLKIKTLVFIIYDLVIIILSRDYDILSRYYDFLLVNRTCYIVITT